MNESELLESMKAMMAAKDETNRNLKELLIAREAELQEAERNLKDCVNELCVKCGAYRNAHIGACNGCRWDGLKDRLYGGCELK